MKKNNKITANTNNGNGINLKATVEAWVEKKTKIQELKAEIEKLSSDCVSLAFGFVENAAKLPKTSVEFNENASYETKDADGNKIKKSGKAAGGFFMYNGIKVTVVSRWNRTKDAPVVSFRGLMKDDQDEAGDVLSL